MDLAAQSLTGCRGGATEFYEPDPSRSDNNNNNRGSSPADGVDGVDDLYSSPSSSSSDREAQLSPDYQDEVFYGKLKVKVRRDGKKLVEKKRRQDLQQQYSNLRSLVPGLQDVEGRTPLSRNVILKKTLHYIEQLKVSMSSSLHLANELRLEQEYSRQLEREWQMWQKKVEALRKKKEQLCLAETPAAHHLHPDMLNGMTSQYGESKLPPQNQLNSMQTIT
ncbi:hairy/enhancer-of-split related with YRPW motif protein-like [Acanthaster planci]|uniref:Hairy/enhancer-of-split related with YRPW motif protein-like n=1 Tax=Acanthaster planci TaxID=133434 RepID=A0A8B7ZP47_ACAPL|nr:hairy/enhancer-of-split related with YRPW motif protein-like [Acanthaster planci]XP_022107364.1 hairy/enhancer-of-split related with YRPW motif protein-like [Acanthaster planci]XP_022107365.1 hairy/enhancer-of-split related with YRPW motif protein-like [Acanthaster planci]